MRKLNKNVNKQILLDQMYDELRDLWREENEDGARWHDVETMVDFYDEDTLLEHLDVSEDQLDLVALGEATDLDDAARILAADGDV